MGDGEDLLESGMAELLGLLGPGWSIARQAVPGDPGVDAVMQISSPDRSHPAQLLIEVKPHVTPRLVEEVLQPKLALIRQVNGAMNMLVLARWIAPRTQQILRGHGINYLDLSGNASIRIPQPAILVQLQGASRPPASTRKDPAPTLAGPRAGRLVRCLTDFEPPYRAGQLARVADVSLPWVSRLLTALEDQLLIRRDGRVVSSVDWPNLLRARAATFELLRHNSYVGMLSPNGLGQVLHLLRESPVTTVTGSYAARAVAPLTAGGQLMLYVGPGPHDPDEIGARLRLIRVDDHADVLLLRAHDPVVFERTRMIEGIRHVALSQLAIDCLSGPGRMPAEGEAVLEYMAATVADWRQPLGVAE